MKILILDGFFKRLTVSVRIGILQYINLKLFGTTIFFIDAKNGQEYSIVHCKKCNLNYLSQDKTRDFCTTYSLCPTCGE